MVKNTSFLNIICQYSNFVTNCFLAPFNTIILDHVDGYKTFQLAPIESLNILGIILFALAVVGFIINRKEKFAKICISWIAFSIILLVFLGYGTRENALVLYSLYFNWAFVSLIFLLFKKLLQNHKKVFITLSIIIILTMLVINGFGFLELVKFGLYNFDRII